ncbi:MAG TPA: efflux RND transporter periplasmic adaptor subunit [Vicinamibacterales bacterium]|nr:efflux RND transporter periplasmic adaptor subunit [Vicinamibacterales bacterium]
MLKKPYLVLALILVVLISGLAMVRGVGTDADPGGESARPTGSVKLARGRFVKSLRMTGLVESIRFHTVAAPRLVGVTGPGSNTLIITRLRPSGTVVTAGQLLVEFDRQSQLKAGMDRRSEHRDFEEQIRKKRGEQEQLRAKDETELTTAANAVENAQLEMKKNVYLGTIDREKNEQRLEEAQAKLKQLKATFDLKRKAEQAEVRILEIQRDRAYRAMKAAEDNASRMVVNSPIPGMVVLRQVWRGNGQVEIQEGEEARPGMPLMQVVDPSAMRVRVKVNQSDVHLVQVGQLARITLDAYPELSFKGRVEQVTPVGTTSMLTTRVRNFAAIVSVDGNHPKLLPDLSAAVDVELQRKDNVIVVPRDAVAKDNDAHVVRVLDDGRVRAQTVTLGDMSDHEVIVTSGLEPGVTVQRHVAQ